MGLSLSLENLSFRTLSATTGHRTPIRLPLFVGLFVWSFLYLYKSSYLSPDGVRYYSLFDDAMITLRYAWHWVHGYGLVWNPGERVEGYSHPFMLLPMAAASLLFSLTRAPYAVQLINLGALTLAAVVALRLMHFVASERNFPAKQVSWAQDIFLFLFFTYYPVLFWTVSGMETTWLTLLLLLAVQNLLLPLHPAYPWRRDLGLAVLFFLMWLCRADSLIYIVPLGLSLFWISYNQWPRRRPALVWGVFLFCVLGQFLFRRMYYGEWMPNAYYLNAGLGWGDRLSNGFRYVWPFLGTMAFPFLLGIVSIVNGGFPVLSLVSLVFVGIAVSYQILAGGDPWPLWRTMVPAVTLMLIPIGFLLSRLAFEWIPTSEKRRPYFLLFIATLVSLSMNQKFLNELILKELPGKQLSARFIQTAIALNDLLKPGASVGVFSSGTLPYYLPHLRAMDFLGRTDRHIAKLPPHRVAHDGLVGVPGRSKYDLRYSVLQLKPTYVEHVKWFEEDVSKEASTLYWPMAYRGMSMLLLKDSPVVFWERFH